MTCRELTDREIAAVVVRVLAAVIVLLAAGVARAIGLHPGDGEVEVAVPAGSVRPGIGPVDGSPIDGYLAERPGALAAASGLRAAVVSFSSYLDDPSARARLGGVEVDRWFVATPGCRPPDRRDVPDRGGPG